MVPGRPNPLVACSNFMATANDLLIGEFPRTLDERFRLGLPNELLDELTAAGQELVLAKERAGCLSLWNAAVWKPRLEASVAVLRSKLAAGTLSQRVDQVQDLGRLLSTRHRTVTLAGRGRLVIPDGFREFLSVDAGGDLLVVGAAVCVELWNPVAWGEFITAEMPAFRRRIDELTT